jgi:hypothetical protein
VAVAVAVGGVGALVGEEFFLYKVGETKKAF